MSAVTHLCMHFHCDPIFTCPQATHIEESIELAAQYVSMCREDPEFRCVLSETDYLQGYWNLYAEDREFLLRLMEEGRVETSGSYSEPNENSVGGEALVRNILYGQWFQVGYLGARGDVYMPHDVFGHVRQLPQILRKAGFIATTWTKGSPRPGATDPCFLWLAPDGSSILTRVTSYGGVDWGASDQIGGVLKAGDAYPGDASIPNLLFRGRDFVSPPGWISGKGGALREHRVLISQPSAFFEEVSARVKTGEYRPPLTAREHSQYHVGTALSRIELKIATRIAEEALGEAETWSAIATLYGYPYPEAEIDHAWRQLLFSQHHDSVTGTSNDQSYLDLLTHLREALGEGISARRTATSNLAEKIATDRRTGTPVVVFNSLGHARTDIVEVPLPGACTGTRVRASNDTGVQTPVAVVPRGTGQSARFIAEDVPGLGYSTYWLSNGDTERSPREEVMESDDAPMVLETPFARITVDPLRGGGIVSLIERKSGREFASGTSPHPLNDFVLLKEGSGVEPSWEFSTTGDRVFASSIRAQVRAEKNPLGWRVVIRQPFPECDHLVRTLELFDHTPRIECSVILSGYAGSRLVGSDTNTRPWGGSNEGKDSEPVDRDMFGVLFPVGLRGLAPVWSDRFGQRVIRRSRSFLDFRTHQGRIYSGCAMFSAEKWIAASPSVSLVAESGDGSRVGVPLGMVRVIHPDDPVAREAADLIIVALAEQGVTATPFLDTEDQNGDVLQTDQIVAIGGFESNAWVAAHDDWKAAGNRFLTSVTLAGDPSRRVPVLILGGCSASARGEASRIVAEICDWRVHLPAEAIETGVLEPLDNAGLAVLNRGTIAASAEPGGELFLALQHSAGWCDWATPHYLGFPFVPERKSTSHHYAIFPFAGSWSEARIPEEAQAYNRPLTPTQTGIHGGELPSKDQFVNLQGESLAISAVKPAGQPSAQFVRKDISAADGFVMRLWNWRGVSCPAQLSLEAGLESAAMVDLAERNPNPIPVRDDTVKFSVGPNAIETVLLNPARFARQTSLSAKGPAPSRLVESRWWRQNLGAAPRGNMPVSVGLRGDLLPGERGTVVLSIAHNRLGESFSGVVRLHGPSGWTVSPTSVPVTLGPRSSTAFEIKTAVPHDTPGRLVCELEYEGHLYVDSLLCGNAAQPDVRADQRGDGFVVRVSNPSHDVLPISIDLITPLDTWAELDTFALRPIPYQTAHLTLEPGEQWEAVFAAGEQLIGDFWAFVKVTARESCQYIPLPLRRSATVHAAEGTSFCLNAPLSDCALLGFATEDVRVKFCVTTRHRPPAGAASSPVPMATYWSLSPVDGIEHVEKSRLRFRINPEHGRKLRDADALSMAVWRASAWVPVPTTFIRSRWELVAEVSPEILREPAEWTIFAPVNERWRVSAGRRFFEAHPEVADMDGDGEPEVVIGTAGNGLCALSSRGQTLWRRKFGGWMWQSPNTTIAEVNGDGNLEIVVAPSDRSLILLDASGHTIWRLDDLPFAVKQKPLVADINGDGRNEILVSIDDNGVFAFDCHGTRLWNCTLEPVRLSAPAIGGSAAGAPEILVNAGGRALAALNADGAVVRMTRFSEGWARDSYVADPVSTDLLIPGTPNILFAGHDGFLRLLAADGTQIWECDLGSPVARAPVVLPAEGSSPPVIVCGAARQTLCGITPAGSIVWRATPRAHVQSPLGCADVDGDGRLEIILGCGRDQRTVIFDRDGNEKASIPYSAIWTNTAVPLGNASPGKASVLVTGDWNGDIVAATPHT
ncbi:MAG TPA: PQQ-binding-like beta-propeller repeat protein [Candidatus Latescibacteria bacterium]|nr:PQQ-binding-like beta-propeller repeat protein [Candidatus Latescibacterota bacterium]